MPIDPERIVSDRYEDWHEAEMNRPLGPAEMATNAALSPFSRALWVGADNLLDKAVRALRAGDADRAVALVYRAASLPCDDHEGSAPGAGRSPSRQPRAGRRGPGSHGLGQPSARGASSSRWWSRGSSAASRGPLRGAGR